MTYSSIHLWGDSIGKGVLFDPSRGRYAIARNACARRLGDALGVPVHNHARMGATVGEGLNDFWFAPPEPGALCALEYGGNDCDLKWDEVAAAPEGFHDGRTPLADFERLLRDFVRAARARGTTPLIVAPPPLDAKRYFAWVTRGRDAEAILRYLGDVEHIYRWQERYALAARDVAREADCALLDLRRAFLDAPRLSDLLCEDGIHPSEAGQALLFETALAFAKNRETA